MAVIPIFLPVKPRFVEAGIGAWGAKSGVGAQLPRKLLGDEGFWAGMAVGDY
jgi:hypothetical protein